MKKTLIIIFSLMLAGFLVFGAAEKSKSFRIQLEGSLDICKRALRFPHHEIDRRSLVVELIFAIEFLKCGIKTAPGILRLPQSILNDSFHHMKSRIIRC